MAAVAAVAMGASFPPLPPIPIGVDVSRAADVAAWHWPAPAFPPSLYYGLIDDLT